MIAMFTDFGWQGPYVGQVEAVLAVGAPGVERVTLMHDAPAFDPRASSYLLAALVDPFPKGTVFLCVVDPGVGTGRRPVVLKTERHWFVGPDNGLLAVAARQAASAEWFEVTWRPERLSESFHGRDLFAPVAAKLAMGLEPEMHAIVDPVGADWPTEWPRVIYRDRYGNLVTGMHGASADDDSYIAIGNHLLPYARTFGESDPGGLFWYRNSMGLIEIAANARSVADILDADVGTPFTLQTAMG